MNLKIFYLRKVYFLLLSLCVASSYGAMPQREPHIGYLYPAGGQQGSVTYVTVGGQYLKGATDVYISGKGVRAEVVKHYKPIINIKRDERQLLQKRLKQVRDKRLTELGVNLKQLPDRSNIQRRNSSENSSKNQTQPKKGATAKTADVKMPEHPLLEDLDEKSLRELEHIRNIIFASRSKRQINRQLAEMVLIKISIDRRAEPGNRELRILSPNGLTSPIVFQIGQLPEVRELEPNNQKANADMPGLVKLFRNTELPKAKPIDLPVVLNGQIMPGDIDRFRFSAEQGQNLVIETHARTLIPYLADAVPGWFQSVVTLYDDKGNEVAYADDYRFNPDPVLFYKIPESGEYELQIRDSIYRGREDFVYRVSISERPFITQMFPLSSKMRIETVASIEGWNLSKTQLPLNTKYGKDFLRHVAFEDEKWISNSVAYAVDTLPQCMSNEPNNTIETAQQITLPKIINGRIDKPGDIDVFKFTAQAGEKVVAEVYGRRLNSPVDSLLQLTDATGKVLAWNDDHVIKDSHLHKDITGLLTHHADSYLMAELPDNGTYFLHISDSLQHGGREYGYSLRIGPPQPDYELRMTPSSLFVRKGEIAPVCVHVLRKDGFDGKIDVILRDTQSGFKLKGGRILSGCDRICMTLEAPVKDYSKPVTLRLDGIALINGKRVRHSVVPAEDMMQAFLYRHLVPSREFMVAVKKSNLRFSPFEIVMQRPIMIKAGNSVDVRVKTAKHKAIEKIELELVEPPEGVTLGEVSVLPEGLIFKIMTEESAIKSDITDNLIVRAYAELKPKQVKGKSRNKSQRISMGVLPAIPIKIVKQAEPQAPADL